ncbi:MAG TPA: protein translocase subunit SecD [Beijerinckiaceae bacterium]|nr:protein translocase subunit SecD [Beijerinckiaceae bacterium]
MLRFARWKVAAILSMTMLAFLIIIPSLLPAPTRESLRKALPSWLPVESNVLGLDLQGGAHLLLQVDHNDVQKTMAQNLRDDVRQTLRKERVPITGGIGAKGRIVQFRIPKPADLNRVMPALRLLASPVAVSGLGGAGPPRADINVTPDNLVQLTITQAALDAKIRSSANQAIQVLDRRVNALGTTEPTIERVGNDRIVVEVPGLKHTSRLKKILGTTAKLEFRFVANPGYSPADVDMLNEYNKENKVIGTYPVEKQVIVQGEDLTDAQPGFDSQTGKPVVNFRFNIRGGQEFGAATSENVGRLFAIVLDNKVISAPVIQGPITGGSGQISGSFTVEQANNLSILLRAGALPAKLTIVEERTVGPGLGQDSINAGKRAAYVGGILVVIYMLITYGTFGVFADLALMVHIGLIFAALILLRATLTLPGIAGIVLTIGMAVDSNVLIYERIREEAKMGRSIVSALDAGFKRAFATIVDSNATMMVAAIILYFLGSGPVRGFAVSLGLGILTSIITAVTMTRMMIALWYQWARPKRLPI